MYMVEISEGVLVDPSGVAVVKAVKGGSELSGLRGSSCLQTVAAGHRGPYRGCRRRQPVKAVLAICIALAVFAWANAATHEGFIPERPRPGQCIPREKLERAGVVIRKGGIKAHIREWTEVRRRHIELCPTCQENDAKARRAQAAAAKKAEAKKAAVKKAAAGKPR